MSKQTIVTVRKAAPNAEETISYAIPSYKLNGMLVQFAAFSKHIGFYPGAGGIGEFADELAGYKTSVPFRQTAAARSC